MTCFTSSRAIINYFYIISFKPFNHFIVATCSDVNTRDNLKLSTCRGWIISISKSFFVLNILLYMHVYLNATSLCNTIFLQIFASAPQEKKTTSLVFLLPTRSIRLQPCLEPHSPTGVLTSPTATAQTSQPHQVTLTNCLHRTHVRYLLCFHI